MQSLSIEHRKPSLIEYQKLRKTTNWGAIPDAIVEKAIENAVFSVCIMDADEIIGMGRVVGDSGIYFYIQDVIVMDAYQKIGVGRMVMADIMLWLEKNACENAFIGLMAAAGSKEFYHQFGFEERPNNRPGMYRQQQLAVVKK